MRCDVRRQDPVFLRRRRSHSSRAVKPDGKTHHRTFEKANVWGPRIAGNNRDDGSNYFFPCRDRDGPRPPPVTPGERRKPPMRTCLGNCCWPPRTRCYRLDEREKRESSWECGVDGFVAFELVGLVELFHALWPDSVWRPTTQTSVVRPFGKRRYNTETTDGSGRKLLHTP